MFEQLEHKTWYPPPWAGLLGAILGAFALGVGVGKLIAGTKPWDWVLTVMDFAILIIYTCWFAVGAIRGMHTRNPAG